jgi:hypothetical protein
MGVSLARLLIGGFGVLLILAGIGVAAIPGSGGDRIASLWFFVAGAVLLAGVMLERTRYRSLHAEHTGDGHGPGGGETTRLEARFRPTEERFVDPTTGVPMRVWIDPRSGEQRYVPEG